MAFAANWNNISHKKALKCIMVWIPYWFYDASFHTVITVLTEFMIMILKYGIFVVFSVVVFILSCSGGCIQYIYLGSGLLYWCLGNGMITPVPVKHAPDSKVHGAQSGAHVGHMKDMKKSVCNQPQQNTTKRHCIFYLCSKYCPAQN